MIKDLLRELKEQLKALKDFILIVVLGFLIAVVFVLPWLIRIASIVVWIGGAFVSGQLLEHVYGPISETLPTMALWVLPSILAALVPVWMHAIGQFKRVWGAMFLYGLLCLAFSFSADWLLRSWEYADLLFRAAPPLLLAVLVIVLSMRLRALRSQKGYVKA